jgi:hypothetical protein
MEPKWREDAIDTPEPVARFFLNGMASRPNGANSNDSAAQGKRHDAGRWVQAREEKEQHIGARAPLSPHPQKRPIWLHSDECNPNEFRPFKTKKKRKDA